MLDLVLGSIPGLYDDIYLDWIALGCAVDSFQGRNV